MADKAAVAATPAAEETTEAAPTAAPAAALAAPAAFPAAAPAAEVAAPAAALATALERMSIVGIHSAGSWHIDMHQQIFALNFELNRPNAKHFTANIKLLRELCPSQLNSTSVLVLQARDEAALAFTSGIVKALINQA